MAISFDQVVYLLVGSYLAGEALKWVWRRSHPKPVKAHPVTRYTKN